MSEKGLSLLLSLRSQARKFQECESSHRMGHGGHSGCALLKRWRCSVCTDEQRRRAKLSPGGTHTLSLIMEGFLHPLEYRWKCMVFQEAYELSNSAQKARETEKSRAMKSSWLHSSQISPPHTSNKQTQMCKRKTDFGEVMYRKTPHVGLPEPPKYVNAPQVCFCKHTATKKPSEFQHYGNKVLTTRMLLPFRPLQRQGKGREDSPWVLH